ncbi:class I SAM-dependent RNA methyltransferase [Microbacterium amylolyticum]|uniref:tRNA/tmRNA/rRNA uracil-C5-methylase (TrmA/RlmC/RlmD family) n=1 Tax=Microbacterium amylolyticum TaxID=936337 RepID=A0ABS4ZJT0_9MICO|nr:TRAM domain-containing protein [Microbacterium amylolyticum]MBP2437549.1 tRNA/tmRNA/rRNA uracil-C5-methylase (TrmA/RlmC/RlmD family) [Microbacterium amylolyticum]
MNTGDIIELDITGVAHGGVFVARHGTTASEPGMVVFVPDTMPGERVRARVTQVKKSFARAEVLDVLEASLHRVAHVWAQADVGTAPQQRPGGADFGHIALAHQRELKQRVITEAFEKFAGGAVPVEVLPARSHEEGTRWRTRVSLHVDAEGRVGPYAARSHDVIEVTEHPLATRAVEAAALGLTREKEGRVDLIHPADGRVRIVRRPASTSRRTAPEVVTERVGEREFRVDTTGFWQVHRDAATALDRVVRSELAQLPVAEDSHHLDLYGGVGLFAAALADHGGTSRVTTVESSARATLHARANLADLNVAAVTARAERFVEQLEPAPELRRGVILLDPPRSGAGEKVVSRIAALSPSAVIYIACDPVALARDVGEFRRAGYDVAQVRALDLFPSSHHVEAVAVLTR